MTQRMTEHILVRDIVSRNLGVWTGGSQTPLSTGYNVGSNAERHILNRS